MEWFRVYHGMVSDDKWSLIARKSGQPRAFVVAVWAMLLEIASQDEDRGSVEAFDPEVADALFDMPDGAAQAIFDALCSGKNPRIADGCILSWEKRQPQREREDSGSAERVRRHRERKRLETTESAGETPRCDRVTPCNAAVTPCNAPRTEKNREEKKEENTYSASAAPDAAHAEDDAPLVGKKKKLTGKRKTSFLRVWEAFGDKRGRVGAIDAWASIPELTDALVERIVSAARRYAALRPELEARGSTPKMAQGWIADRRWEDEPPGSCPSAPQAVVSAVPLPEIKVMTPDEVARHQKAALERLRGEGRVASALKKPVSPDFRQALGGVQ